MPLPPITSGTVTPFSRPSINRCLTAPRPTPPPLDKHPDHLGSTNVVTDASGTVAQLLDYYPYGATRVSSNTYPTNEKRQYIGQFSDAQTNLNYLNARYYDGSRGQFLSQDPTFLAMGNSQQLEQLSNQNLQRFLADPQQVNSYSYASDNPVVKKDPNGNNPYVIAGAAAYTVSIGWDLRVDVYSNLRDTSVPWYSKLTPRGDDAALRYNKDAYTSAAMAIAVTGSEVALAPVVAKKIITSGGAKVLAATVGGVANAADAWFTGNADDPTTGQTSPTALFANFASGFFGARIGQAIPNPRGAPPVTFAGSLVGARASTEQVRALLGQVVQALTNYVNSLQAQKSASKKPRTLKTVICILRQNLSCFDMGFSILLLRCPFYSQNIPHCGFRLRTG
jgi:RHS repeat-associated protein